MIQLFLHLPHRHYGDILFNKTKYKKNKNTQMKQASILIASFAFALTTSAQTKTKPSTTPVKKPVAASTTPALALKTLTDSASYAIGQNIAQAITKDLTNLNKEAFLTAIKSVFNDQTPKFNEEDAHGIMMRFSTYQEENKNRETIEQGRTFLEKNKLRPEVKTTASGLQYEVITEGSGDKATAEDEVVCHYRGTLVDGTPFDNSYDRGEPLTINTSSVIKGWTEGLQLMNKGAKYKFYIPYELGYGLRDAGEIPAGSALIFEVELLDIKK